MEPPRDRLASPTQRDVYDLLVRGLSNEEIGADLGMVVRTVKHHVTQVLKATGFSRRGELIAAHGRAHANGKTVGFREQIASPRRREVYDLIVEGALYKDAAKSLGLTERTVKFHATGLLKELGIQTQSRLIAAHWGARTGRRVARRRAGGGEVLIMLERAIAEAEIERARLDELIEKLETAVRVLER